MRKLIIAMMVALLCCTGALAESGRIDDQLFNSAKQTLHSIDTGNYTTASALLGCADKDTLEALATQQFTTLGAGTAQTRISVAFFHEQAWYIAVPTAEPANAEVEALLLNCGSGNGFVSAERASWGDVQAMLDASGAIIWNEEYAPDVVVIVD